MSAIPALHENPLVQKFFNDLETESSVLFEYIDVTFLGEFEIFRPDSWGRDKDFEAPELFRGLIHCYNNDIYSPTAIVRELANATVLVECGLDRPPSYDVIRRFLIDFNSVADEVFRRLVEEAATHGLLDDDTARIDATDVRACDQQDEDASWNFDSTAGETYYGYGTTVVSTGANIPVAYEFTESKPISEETAMRVTEDALAVEEFFYWLGDAGLDILAWHDRLLEDRKLPIARYNPRNTEEPLDITYRVEDQIKDHFSSIRLNQEELEKTFKQRIQVENTFQVCKIRGLGQLHVRGHVRAESHVVLCLCLRLLVAIANAERGGCIGSPFVHL